MGNFDVLADESFSVDDDAVSLKSERKINKLFAQSQEDKRRVARVKKTRLKNQSKMIDLLG